MIGIDGHVLFLPPKKKKKKVGLARICRTLLSTLGGLGDRAPPQPNLPAALTLKKKLQTYMLKPDCQSK